MKKVLSASLMCADLLRMEESVAELEKAGIDYLHIDIMDGCFVPNITLGFDFVNAVKSITKLPLDVHMMVNNPSEFIDRMNLDENDILSVHFESDIHIHRTLSNIKEKGIKTGLALNPQTSAENLEPLMDYIDMALIMTVSPGFAGQRIFDGADRKTKKARAILDELGRKYIPIEVDGNISPENGRMLSGCGADIFVLGTSSLFINGKDMKTSVSELRSLL
ncbi:MAG: ribulose-phosphate 3-epimerase [Clostridia bacterium]|nr:ribulose-phosphate 3-epimerase [Clostridia bacterium]